MIREVTHEDILACVNLIKVRYQISQHTTKQMGLCGFLFPLFYGYDELIIQNYVAGEVVICG